MVLQQRPERCTGEAEGQKCTDPRTWRGPWGPRAVGKGNGAGRVTEVTAPKCVTPVGP